MNREAWKKEIRWAIIYVIALGAVVLMMPGPW